LKPDVVFLVVHRIDNSVYFRRVVAEEFAVLNALRRGKPLGKAVEAAFRKSKMPTGERAESVQQWFQNWATLGWFCQPAQVSS
jgi:hypothetical protein